MQKRYFIYGGLTILAVFAGIVLGRLWHNPAQTERSPYVAQLDSSIRGLSPQEVDDLLNGRGAGYARTAELNSYPGPRHVLDLKQNLHLTTEQTEQIEAVFTQMQTEAKQVGQEILQHETQFSSDFANRSISQDEIKEQTEALGQLYGQLRAVHLQAHLQITPLLSAEQLTQYNALRGYNPSSDQIPASQHHHQTH